MGVWSSSKLIARFLHTGLMYDDILVDTPDVKRAVDLLPDHLWNARMQRIKIASDCSLKGIYLPGNTNREEKKEKN